MSEGEITDLAHQIEGTIQHVTPHEAENITDPIDDADKEANSSGGEASTTRQA